MVFLSSLKSSLCWTCGCVYDFWCAYHGVCGMCCLCVGDFGSFRHEDDDRCSPTVFMSTTFVDQWTFVWAGDSFVVPVRQVPTVGCAAWYGVYSCSYDMFDVWAAYVTSPTHVEKCVSVISSTAANFFNRTLTDFCSLLMSNHTLKIFDHLWRMFDPYVTDYNYLSCQDMVF